jgi:hypothetical protein
MYRKPRTESGADVQRKKTADWYIRAAKALMMFVAALIR